MTSDSYDPNFICKVVVFVGRVVFAYDGSELVDVERALLSRGAMVSC